LISPIQSATEEMVAPATALLVRSVLSTLLIPLHGGKFIRCDAAGKTDLPSFFILEILKNQFAPSGLSGVFFLRGPGDQARRDIAE